MELWYVMKYGPHYKSQYATQKYVGDCPVNMHLGADIKRGKLEILFQMRVFPSLQTLLLI